MCAVDADDDDLGLVDEPTEESEPPVDDVPPEAVLLPADDEVPLVLARAIEPPERVPRGRRPDGEGLLRVFTAVSTVPGYQGCLLVDASNEAVLHADGVALTLPPALVHEEVAAWRAALRIAADDDVDEIITVTAGRIVVSRPAEPTGRLFFVALCSTDHANLALVRLALQPTS
ncbi:MAG: hypothetical protein R3F59_26465 [Myxococcota bacterium]